MSVGAVEALGFRELLTDIGLPTTGQEMILFVSRNKLLFLTVQQNLKSSFSTLE